MIGKKIAFSGTHGTGKTTSVAQAFLDWKINNHDKTVTIFTENARDSPFPINKNGTQEGQLWIFCNQLQKELLLQQKYDVVICDRSVCDSIAYTKFHGLDNLVESMISLASHHMNTYDEIIFKKSATNNYWFKDGLRDSEDTSFRLGMENALIDIYDTLIQKYNCNFKLTMV
jgi:predicted ATPase